MVPINIALTWKKKVFIVNPEQNLWQSTAYSAQYI